MYQVPDSCAVLDPFAVYTWLGPTVTTVHRVFNTSSNIPATPLLSFWIILRKNGEKERKAVSVFGCVQHVAERVRVRRVLYIRTSAAAKIVFTLIVVSYE